jgi:hypothetical protein
LLSEKIVEQTAQNRRRLGEDTPENEVAFQIGEDHALLLPEVGPRRKGFDEGGAAPRLSADTSSRRARAERTVRSRPHDWS